MRSRLALVEESTSAEDERTGAMRLALHCAVAAELEHVVARDLRVVGGVVARLAALVVHARSVFQFASIGRWQPTQLVVHDEMAGVAGHLVVAVRALGRRHRGPPALLVVIEAAARARASRAPPSRCTRGASDRRVSLTSEIAHSSSGVDRRALVEALPAPLEAPPPVGRAQRARGRCRPCGAAGPEVRRRRVAVRGAVAVGAVDLDRRRDLAVEWPLPCASCAKWQSTQCMPISRWIDVRCTAFLNFAGSSSATGLSVRVEQRALAVALEDGAEVPAVAVVVGELRVLELRVELHTSFRKLTVAPVAAAPPPPRGCGRGCAARSSAVG